MSNNSNGYPPKTNIARPDALARFDLRMPKELKTDINNWATILKVSCAEVILNAIENEFARQVTYGCNYYRDIRPLRDKIQRQRCRTSSKNVRHEASS